MIEERAREEYVVRLVAKSCDWEKVSDEIYIVSSVIGENVLRFGVLSLEMYVNRRI